MKEKKKKENGVNKKKILELFKWIAIVWIYAVFILFIIISMIYLSVNLKILNIFRKSNSNEINIKYNMKYFVLCNKNQEYINNSNKDIYIVNDNYTIKLNNKGVKKFTFFDVNIEYVDNIGNNIDGLTSCNVKLDKKTDLETIDSIGIHLDSEKISSNIVDIYTGQFEEYNMAYEVKNSNVQIDFDEVEKNREYIIVHVPLKEIRLSENNIKINKGDSKQIDISLVPDNATNKVLKFDISDTNILTINSTGTITGKSAGTASITIGVENEDAISKIDAEVIPILEEIKLSSTSITIYTGNSATITATVVPKDAVNNNLEWISSDESIATVDKGKIISKKVGKCVITVKNTEGNIIEKKINVQVKNKPVYASYSGSATVGVTYIKGILVVNKKYALPSTYNPGVNGEAYNALKQLQAGAKAAGYNIPLRSGFRSYNTQKTLYNRYVSQYGQALTDTFSARPGHSEHQTGLAFDVGAVNDNYGNTPAGKWLAANCYKYGFIIRYPKGKQAITGYKYEPWHIRYLGVTNATSVHNSGLCLEEYLGI